MSETRRLAAILAADVVGYLRLMGADEAGTARAVREHRDAAAPIVRGFGGRLVKTMGDGVLLEFPSVVAAVERAIRMQQQMAERNAGVPETKRTLYRIGVNLGDVLIEGADILGDGVNIAARLEGICGPGGVCISGSAHDHVRGRIGADFVDLGEKPLKGQNSIGLHGDDRLGRRAGVPESRRDGPESAPKLSFNFERGVRLTARASTHHVLGGCLPLLSTAAKVGHGFPRQGN